MSVIAHWPSLYWLPQDYNTRAMDAGRVAKHCNLGRRCARRMPASLDGCLLPVRERRESSADYPKLNIVILTQLYRQIWTRGTSKICRGIAATGSQIRTLEASLVGGSEYHLTAHKPDECGMMYESDDLGKSAMNPIVGESTHTITSRRDEADVDLVLSQATLLKLFRFNNPPSKSHKSHRGSPLQSNPPVGDSVQR